MSKGCNTVVMHDLFTLVRISQKPRTISRSIITRRIYRVLGVKFHTLIHTITLSSRPPQRLSTLAWGSSRFHAVSGRRRPQCRVPRPARRAGRSPALRPRAGCCLVPLAQSLDAEVSQLPAAEALGVLWLPPPSARATATRRGTVGSAAPQLAHAPPAEPPSCADRAHARARTRWRSSASLHLGHVLRSSPWRPQLRQ